MLLALLQLCSVVSAGVLIMIILFVAREAVPALKGIGVRRIFTDETWHPTASQFNMLPMLVGTLAATVGSLLLTAPLGIGSAVFLRFYAAGSTAWCYRTLRSKLSLTEF